jgi:Glycosyl transferases group 1
MSRVFVVGAYIPRGGTYMAYHLGRILGRRLGLDPVAVRVRDETPDRGVFDYPEVFPSVAVDDLLDVAEADDLLVCNPMFSPRAFGLHFPGRTLMYVQGVNTYAVIDGFFDHHVACSRFVHDHLALHYGWDVPVIVPFVHTERIGETPPWELRAPGSVAVVTKSLGDELIERLHDRLAEAHPDVVVELTRLKGIPHHTMLSELARHRYLLTLTALEGHPLMPLEGMLSGCCVVGFHGGGGLEYMRPGLNAAVVGFPRIDAVADELAELVRCPTRAAVMAAQGRADVGHQTYDAFEASWSAFADAHLAT